MHTALLYRLLSFSPSVVSDSCDPMNCSLPGSSVHGTCQARTLEWLPFPSLEDLPDPGVEPRSSTLQADALPSEPPGKSTEPLGKPKYLMGEQSEAKENERMCGWEYSWLDAVSLSYRGLCPEEWCVHSWEHIEIHSPGIQTTQDFGDRFWSG